MSKVELNVFQIFSIYFQLTFHRLRKSVRKPRINYGYSSTLCSMFITSILRKSKGVSYSFKRQLQKIVKHTQTIRQLLTDELFECVWPFVGLTLKGLRLIIKYEITFNSSTSAIILCTIFLEKYRTPYAPSSSAKALISKTTYSQLWIC